MNWADNVTTENIIQLVLHFRFKQFFVVSRLILYITQTTIIIITIITNTKITITTKLPRNYLKTKIKWLFYLN